MSALGPGEIGPRHTCPPLRVLEYITSGSMGGAEHGLLMEAEEFVRRGHFLRFVSPRGRKLSRVLAERGFAPWTPRTYGKVDPWTCWRVSRLIRHDHIDIVHTHLSTGSLLGSFAARLAGVPSVATVHGLNSAFCYRYCTLVVAVSHAVKAHLVAQNIAADRIRVVHNGVSVDHFLELPTKRAARDSLGMDCDEPMLLYAGRLSPEKGVSLLPAVLKEVHRQVPRARLVVLGEGALRAHLSNEFEKLGLSGSVSMPGYHADTRPFLAAADLLLLPSYKEGLPRILLEAMVSGLPAVGTNAGGIPEALTSGITGEVVSIGDIAALADACSKLLTDPARREAMSEAAASLGRGYFSVRRTVTELEQVFSEAREIGTRGSRSQGETDV